MVGEMLSLTALHSGNFVLRAAPLLIAELLREALAAHGPAAAGKRITLHSELPTPGPTVTADRDALRSVFANLIDNALKYTPAGGRVTVALALDAQAAVITVTDTGIGMTPQEQARAFEEFYRARNPATANVPGTGLGLTLVKRLVELHSGTVTLRSAPGHGATFTLSLPLAPSTA